MGSPIVPEAEEPDAHAHASRSYSKARSGPAPGGWRRRAVRDAAKAPLARGGVLCEAPPRLVRARLARVRAEHMAMADVVVIGGGVSGLAFAWQARAAGRKVARRSSARSGSAGACTRTAAPTASGSSSARTPATTATARSLEIVGGRGRCAAKSCERGPARARFGSCTAARSCLARTPPSSCCSSDKLELLPFTAASLRREEGRRDRLLVLRAARRAAELRPRPRPVPVGGPVPEADAFPADMLLKLFRKRPRRKDFPRSFTLRAAGSSVVVRGGARQPRRDRRDGRAR